MAKDKKAQTTDIEESPNIDITSEFKPLVEDIGVVKEVAIALASDGKTITEVSFVEKSAFSHKVEHVMPVIHPHEVPIIEKDDMFALNDEVEVHGLMECRDYIMIGKVAKILGNYSYAIQGHAFLKNKTAIGHDGVLARTFKAENLRKVTIKREK